MNRLRWLGVALLLALAGLLVVRTLGTARAVLDPTGASDAAPPAEEARSPLVAALELKDSLLVAAEPCERDPFRWPPRPPAPVVKKPPPTAEPETVPSLSALLYDNVAPTVQVKIGGATSPWLKEGSVFRGWTIVDIEPDSVVVAKDGRRAVLR